MDTDIPSQEGREDVPSELSFVSAPRENDPMPVVTRPVTLNSVPGRVRARGLARSRPQPWSLGHAHARAEE